jgi:hypothetical protein
MTSSERVDPLSFSGCFAYLGCDVPAGMTLAAWRSQRTSPKAEHREIVGASTAGPAPTRISQPGSHPTVVQEGASAARGARPLPEAEPIAAHARRPKWLARHAPCVA